MKTVGRYIFDSLALALLAGCIGAGPANAQQGTGKFSLPFEAHWNGITLLPGNYSFRFNRPLGGLTLARGYKNVAMILPSSLDRKASTESSLLLEEVNGVPTVCELRLADSDLVLLYRPQTATQKLIEARRLVPITAQGATLKRGAIIAAPMPGAAPASTRPGMGLR